MRSGTDHKVLPANYFQFKLPSELIEKKKTKFEENYNRCVLVMRDICVRVS